MNTYQLASLSRQYTILRAELMRRFPTLREDETALADSLDGISDLKEAIAAVIASIADDETLSAAIVARCAELSERHSRIDHRIEQKKAAVLYAMMESGTKSLELTDATIATRQNPPSVVVKDETLVPDYYLIFPDQPAPRIDKRTVLAALKIGERVPGCELSNGTVGLQIRKK